MNLCQEMKTVMSFHMFIRSLLLRKFDSRWAVPPTWKQESQPESEVMHCDVSVLCSGSGTDRDRPRVYIESSA